MKTTRLIDADAAISGVKNRCIGQNDVVKVEHSIISMLYMMPTIEAEPVRHGKWIESDEYDEYRGRLYRCSNCNTFVVSDFDNYCPYCGARMDAEND